MALHHFVPQDRLSALRRGEPLPERAEGAVLFADISGFTALTEALCQREGERRGIEAVSQRVNAAFAALVAEVDRQQGSVIGFAGDAITCWFDARDGAAAERAAHAARGMQSAIARLPELALKVMVGCGPARRFVVGHPEVQRIDALAGATLDRVASADGLALPGEVLIDEATARALGVPMAAPRSTVAGDCFVVLDPAMALPKPPTGAHPALRAEATDEQLLRPWLLPLVFERETSGQPLFLTDLRPATALFMRLTGLDHDRDDQAVATLHGLVSQAQLLVQRHGGVVLELTLGDKGCYLYASFGAARVHEDDAARALRAALSLRQAWAGVAVTAHFGVSSGAMRVGGYGAPTRQSFGAIGDEVNTAARLMGRAQPGEILISGRVRQAVGEEFALEARAPMPMKGKADPMPVFAVQRVQLRRAIRLQEPVSSTPLVGREAETAALAAGVATALHGQGRVLALVADAGMGKSRLVAEGVRLARGQGFMGFGGSCRMDGIRTPYLVWQTIWTAFFDLDPALPLRRQIRGLEAELRRHVPEHAEAWPLLGTVLGIDWPDNDFTGALQPKDRKALLETLLLQCLVSAAREALDDGIGLLLVLEDLHAADPLSLDLLALVARAIEPLPVLLLLSHRPVHPGQSADPGALLAGLPHAARIELGALDGGQVEQVIRAKLATLFPQRGGAVPAALIERITERAQGNPFYVEELLNYLRDRGLDPRHEAAASLELPPSLHSLVLSRVDQLAAQPQLTLKVASVIDRVFRDADLWGYHPALGAADEVMAALDELDRLGLTPREPTLGEGSHVFKHRVTQEVAYESIAHAARTELHGRYARHLEQRHADQLAAQAAQLAHHCERAAMTDKAALYLRLAGEQAAARYANDEALDYFARALRCLPLEAAAARFELLLQSEAILALQGRHDQGLGQLLDAQALVEAQPDPVDAHAQLAVRRSRLEINAGDHPGARRWAQSAIAALDGQPHAPLTSARVERLVDALQLEARALFHGGDAVSARPQLQRALALARQHGYRRGECSILSMQGLQQWQLGDHDSAERLLGEALALAGQAGDERRRLDILNNLGVVAMSRARHDAALACYEKAQAIARRIGDRSGEAMLLNNMGDVCLELGDFGQAAQYTEQAARMFHQANEPVSRGSALINRAEAHRGLGQFDAARALSLQALALLRAGQHRRGEAVVLDNLGLLDLAQGHPAAAVATAREALALAREIGASVLEAGILRNLGRAHTAAGQPGAAAEALAAAATLARDGQADALAAEVDAAQAELGLARGGPDAATQAVAHLAARVLPRWMPSHAEPAAALGPMWVALVALRALAAANDARAPQVLTTMRRELQRRAQRIADARSRSDFLAVAEHAEIGSIQPPEA
jgi:class 3 adenylate cyclase/tetratricopeptide (TPR) repeat protein